MSERRGKYGAKKATIDGITFDSQAEARRYQELRLMALAGEIADIRVHVRYEIVPKDKHGKALYYEADFSYVDFENNINVVEDVKGVRTAVYNLKRRLFLARYPIYDFREIVA